MKYLSWGLLLALLLGPMACRPTLPAGTYNTTKSLMTDQAMVVSPHPIASEIGVAILKKGGNAVDAAIAVQFAIAVCYPRAGNVGGGGFMVIRQQDGTTAALDYREKAPLKAHRDMYLDSLGNVIEGLSTGGHLAAGVPGTVAGLLAAHERYGRLPLRELIQPAIQLASTGYAITATEANRLQSFQEAFRQHNDTPNPFIKDTWQTGDRLIQPELAQTLLRIQQQGWAGFYEGSTADAIVAEMQSGNGIISHEDLKNYAPAWRQPLVGNYKDYRVISMPPSSSGGVALLQMLGMVESFPLSEMGFHSPAAVHLMAEAERRAYADRAEHLGDSDFYRVPINLLIDEEYLQHRMSNFSANAATVSNLISAGNFNVVKENFETTHTSVVDAEGNAVSVTTTLNSNFGCKVWVDGAGFFLNNEMDDFSVKPGVPNQFGLVGAEANAIVPGKRMLSSMTPTIIEKNGDVFMVIGAPGGSTIITAVFQVFLNVVEFGMPLDAAVHAGRFHHQWLPDQIMVEKAALDSLTRQALTSMGHTFREVNSMAVIKAIQRLPDGRLHGAGDPRNPDDTAAGY